MEHGNLTGTAQSLRVSQPMLNRQIHAIEPEHDTALFAHGARSMMLTEADKRLHEACKASSGSFAYWQAAEIRFTRALECDSVLLVDFLFARELRCAGQITDRSAFSQADRVRRASLLGDGGQMMQGRGPARWRRRCVLNRTSGRGVIRADHVADAHGEDGGDQAGQIFPRTRRSRSGTRGSATSHQTTAVTSSSCRAMGARSAVNT
jgi:hypothetical protein